MVCCLILHHTSEVLALVLFFLFPFLCWGLPLLLLLVEVSPVHLFLLFLLVLIA